MAYTNKARIQNFLLINIDDSFASQIDEWILVVKEYIDDYCGREFEQESDTDKTYDGDGTKELLIDDLLTLTKIEILDEDGTVDYTFDATTEYYLYPTNKTPKTRIVINTPNAPIGIFPKGYQNVKITGTFGFATTVPEDIRFAATKLVAAIIQEGNYDIGSEIKSERLGEYSITYQDVSKLAERMEVDDILLKHRRINV